jgi:hypothetical protein
MKLLKTILLIFGIVTTGACYESHKSVFKALIIQGFIPGLGNYYIDDNWKKPLIYTPIIFTSGLSAAIISGSHYKYKDPLVVGGFSISAGTYIISFIDLINTCVKLNIKFVELKSINNGISINYNF